MTWVARDIQKESGESGYTLVEVVVALALLMTALVPASTMLLYLVQRPEIELRMEALAHAQAAIEETLSELPASWVERDTTYNQWTTSQDVHLQETLATVRVSVYRGSDTLAVLSTSRYIPESDAN